MRFKSCAPIRLSSEEAGFAAAVEAPTEAEEGVE